MRVYKAIERALEALIVFFWRAFIFVHEMKNIWAKRALVRSFRPTEEQAQGAEAYWKGILGHGIPLWWHRLYASYTGKWDLRFIPEILYSVKLEPNGSRRADVEALDDKIRLDVFAGDGLRVPKEHARCCAGTVTQDGCLIPASKIHEALGNVGPCVIKRTRDTSSGRDVSFADFEGGVDRSTGLDVASIVSGMGSENFARNFDTGEDLVEDSGVFHLTLNQLAKGGYVDGSAGETTFLAAANLNGYTHTETDPLSKRGLPELQSLLRRIVGGGKFVLKDTVFIPAKVD